MQWTAAAKAFLVVVAGGIFVGVFFASLFESLTVLFVTLLSIVVIGGIFFVARTDKRLLFLLTLLFLISALLGVSRVWVYESTIPRTLDQFVNTKNVIEGVVVEAPDRREFSTRLTVAVEKVNDAPIKGKILASVDRFASVAYGDRVLVSGVLNIPEAFETETGRTFDYRKFLLAHRVTHVVRFAEVDVLESSQGSGIIGLLLGVRDALIVRIERILPDPEAPLLAGLLLGERQSLGDDLYRSFQRAGVVHMIVLSGYNVSLVVAAILKVTETLLPRIASFSVAGLGIVAFALMTGASETTVRASLMAGVLILATALRRPHYALRALLFAGIVMIVINPFLLLYDLSFQLSFLATGGIILFADVFSKRLAFLPEKFGIREIGGATIAAQLSVLPILIISIGSVSIVSPVANLAVLVAVPWAMLFGFIASTLAFVSTWLAYPFTVVTYVFLTYILNVSVWFGDIPISTIIVPPHAVVSVSIGTMLIYGLLLWRFRKGIVLKSPPRLDS